MGPRSAGGVVGALALVAFGCAGPRSMPPPAPEEKALPAVVPAAPIAFALPVAPASGGEGSPKRGRCDDPNATTARWTLAHFNDLQARWSSRIGERSRYGYIAGYLRALTDEVPETLVLDAGDDYEKGSLAELRSMGEATRRMVQALPIDARTIGNHDFAYGEAAVRRDVDLSAHPVLAANVEGPFVPFARFDVGCVRVGVIGLVTQNYGADDQPTKAPFDGVFAHDDRYAAVLDREVRAHRADVDVLVALDHLGLAEDIGLATKVAGVDLVVGGHSEDLVKKPIPIVRKDGSRAWVLQAGHWAEELGRADLAWDRVNRTLAIERYQIVPIDASLPYAEDVGDLATRLEREYAPDAERPIATLKADVPQGHWMADLVWRAARDRWGADALLVGRDVFWDKLRAGPVTGQALYDTVYVQREPAGTSGFASLWSVTLSGKDLLAVQSKATNPVYDFFGPGRIDPERSYRLLVEKRAIEAPRYAFGAATPPPALREGRFAGEIVDVLEAYAKERTARGLTLD